MIITHAKRALGNRDGDTLTIANAWEDVTIVRVEDAPGVSWYELEGMSDRVRYPSIGPALVAAFEYLATYTQGRCD